MKIKQVEMKAARIEMMPLIDSFFLILVYFIYAFLSMSTHKGIPLDLPQAATSVEHDVEHMSLSITKEGDIFLDRQLVDKEVLVQKLNAIKMQIETEEQALYIYGDREASHGQVIELFDQVRKAGITKVFIQTEPLVDED